MPTLGVIFVENFLNRLLSCTPTLLTPTDGESE